MAKSISLKATSRLVVVATIPFQKKKINSRRQSNEDTNLQEVDMNNLQVLKQHH
jgi:hypothetical protein